MNNEVRDEDCSPEDAKEVQKFKQAVLRSQKKDIKVHETLEKSQYILFWDYNYAARSFIVDLKEKVWFRKRYDVSTVILSFLMKHEGISEHYFERAIRELVIAYNAEYNKNPKFSYQILPGEQRNEYRISKLTKDELKAARFFLYVSFKYGYTFTKRVYPHQLDSRIIQILRNPNYDLNLDHIQQRSFIKYRGDKNDGVRFNFVNRQGRSFFENEKGGNLYLYIDPEEYHARKNTQNISEVISAWKKRRGLGYYQHNDKALIQVIVNGETIHNAGSSHDLAKEIDAKLDYLVLSYNTWIDYAKLADSQLAAKTIKHIYVPRHEQVPDQARAIGLWLWDLVHFEKMSQTEAIKHVLDASFGHYRKASDDRVLRRDYALAANCIKHCKVLKCQDIVPAKQEK